MKRIFKRLDGEEKVDIKGYLAGEFVNDLDSVKEKTGPKSSVVFEDKDEVVIESPALPVVKEEIVKKTQKMKRTKPKAAKAKAIKPAKSDAVKPKVLISKDAANSYLADVPSDNGFILRDGTELKNLRDLHRALTGMDEETFSHHFSDGKHDFYNWVLHVIGDKTLANSLKRAKARKTMAIKVGKRIGHLVRRR